MRVVRSAGLVFGFAKRPNLTINPDTATPRRLSYSLDAMSKVSSTIEAKVRATFSPQEAGVILSALAEMKDPPSEGGWSVTRARVQAAILISAQSELSRVLKGISDSQVDWRDTLMASGLAESNWPHIAKEAGFDIV